jgi:hypothetical protein
VLGSSLGNGPGPLSVGLQEAGKSQRAVPPHAPLGTYTTGVQIPTAFESGLVGQEDGQEGALRVAPRHAPLGTGVRNRWCTDELTLALAFHT